MNQKANLALVRLGIAPLTPASVYALLYTALFGCAVLGLVQKTWAALLFPAYFMLALLLITTLSRTLPLRWFLFCFIYGATIVPVLALALGWPAGQVFGLDSRFRGGVIIPLLEETIKLAPILVLLAWRGWRYRWTAGASDLMLLGAAVGGGFLFWEDTILGFWPGGVGRQSATEFLLDMHAATPHVGPLYLYPTMDIGTAHTAFIGHMGATAFVALGIGLARLLGRRLGAAVWALPALAWGWVVAEHGLFNYVIDSGGMSGITRFVYSLDGYGRLSSLAFYLLLLATLALERRLLWRSSERTRPYRLERANLRLLAGGVTNPLDYLAQVLDLRVYLRERRALTYGLHYFHAAGREQGKDEKRLDYLTRLAGTLAEWKAKVEVAPSLLLAEAQEAVA